MGYRIARPDKRCEAGVRTEYPEVKPDPIATDAGRRGGADQRRLQRLRPLRRGGRVDQGLQRSPGAARGASGPRGADRHQPPGASPAGHPHGQKKNLLFAWAEVGAKYVGILQGLPVTCRMHGINPYDYLVDVLQRINQLPASQVLTPGCGSSTPPTTPCVHLCTAPAAEQRHHPVTACNACTAPSLNVSCVKATDLGANVGVITAMLPATHDVPETEVAPGAPSSGQSCAESVPAHGRIHQGSGSRGAASAPDSSSKAIH